MQQRTETNYYREESIDFIDIINQLIASKKLIIIITLLTTILAFFYANSKPPTFKSSALIEIGHHNLMSINQGEGRPEYLKIVEGQKTLIERPENLVRELNIFFAHKKQNRIQGVLSISIIEDRLINIETKASSSEIAINSVNKITSYILNRHENIITGNTQRNLNLINTNLELLNSEIEFNSGLADSLKAVYAARANASATEQQTDIHKRILEIQQLLPTIDKKINALELVISEDTANLRLLETDPQLLKERAAIPPTLSEVIYLYKNSILDFESKKVNLHSELMILQASLSDFLENISEDSNDLNHNYLPSNLTIDKQIYTEISARIFQLLQEKNIQEKNLKSLMAQTSSNSALIGEITSVQSNPKTMKFALQGFIFGAILSIVLVLIFGKFKALKEENAITL